jgi:hypothetical protein
MNETEGKKTTIRSYLQKTHNLFFLSVNDDQNHFIRLMSAGPYGASSFYLDINSKDDHSKVAGLEKEVNYNDLLIEGLFDSRI